MVESLFNKSSKDFALPAALSDDHHCKLGRWIYSSESAPYADKSDFTQLKEAHKAFHQKAGLILSLFQQGNIDRVLSVIG